MSAKYLDMFDEFTSTDEKIGPTVADLNAIKEIELIDLHALASNFGKEDPVYLYLSEISSLPELSINEMNQLSSLLCQGNDKIHQQLIEAGLRLVVSIAKDYVGQGILFMDLIQEGSLGLVQAIDQFIYSEDYKFTSFATWYIQEAIYRAISEQDRSVRTPVQLANDFRQISQQLHRKLHRDPTAQEISKAMDLSLDTVDELMKLTDNSSAEDPISEEDIMSNADSFELHARVEELLSTLPKLDAQLLRLRFGLEDGQAHTQAEVAATLGLTLDQVKQIESKALNKMSTNQPNEKILKNYIKQ